MNQLFCKLFFVTNLFLTTQLYEVKVNVQQGTLLGIREFTLFENKLYFAFYGVPYARPPVGNLRFKDPKAPSKWKKPFDARTQYHGACAQAHIIHKHALYGYEDCLNLNIYTPCLPDNGCQSLKAVIVWIHGYAFTSSFSHVHGADFLIDNEVIFISVTHRIGVFGFLKVNDSDSNANMGLKDIVMALKWIRKNVKKFGGEKNNITVMGSGSAGTFITLLTTTSFKKIFSKIILQSGTLFSPTLFQSNPSLERNRLLYELKIFTNKNLVSASTKNIVMASQKIYKRKEIINFNRPVAPFTPLIEKVSNKSLITDISRNTYKIMKKDDLQVPILIGFNSQESISEIIPFLHNTQLLKNFEKFFKYMVPFSDGCKYNSSSKLYKEVATKIKERYFKGGLSEQSIQNFVRYSSDLHIYPIYKYVKLLAAQKRTVYVYKFNYIGKFNAVKTTSLAGTNILVKGAAEGDEICYILKCEPLWENYVKLKHDLSNKDRIFLKRIAEMWANFAKFGDPVHNKKGNITWSPTTLGEDNVFIFGNKDKLIYSEIEQNMFKFWNDIYNKYYHKKHCDNIHDEL